MLIPCLTFAMENQRIIPQKHHQRSNSGETIVINIDSPKHNTEELENAKEERKNKLQKARLVAISAVIASGLTALVSLIIHFEKC